MPWLFLSGALKRVGDWLSSLSFWQLAFGAVAIFALVQHFELAHSRAEAARWHKQFDAEHSGRIADRQAYVKAQEQAAALALKQKQDTEARYAALATEKDQEYALGLQNGRDAALRYIATHGLRPDAPGSPSGPATPAKDNSSVLPAKLPPDPIVVSAGDVQACTAATAYAIAVHNWALQLSADPANSGGK